MGDGGSRRAGWPPAGVVAGLWLAALGAVYVLTLRPTIAWNDGPEFVDVAFTLGVAHPPGSPTYALLGKLATLLPLGAVAARVSLLSALCALATLALLARAVGRAHTRLGGRPAAGSLAGLLAATLLAVAPTFWGYATQAEVYAPFALVTALLLFLAVRWEETLDERYLLAGAFVFGLSGGVHGTAIFFAPALAILVLLRMPRGRIPGAMARAALFGLLGASVYLYLPLRAATEPAFNWGDPDSWSRFWAHVSDRKDDAKRVQAVALPWWPHVRIFARNLDAEMTPAGWAAALAGIGLLARRAPRLALFTVALCLGNLLFFLRIWTIPDAYLPTFVIAAFWAGLALARLGEGALPDPAAPAREKGSRGAPAGMPRRVAAALGGAAVLLAVAFQAGEGSARARARANDAARSAAEANFLPLPDRAIAVVTANWFPMRYLQDVEGMRPDVTILLASDLTLPVHFTPVTRERFPRIAVPEGDPRSARWDEYFRRLIAANLGRAPIYWEPLSVLSRNVAPYLRPWRYLWRFDPVREERLPRAAVDAYFLELRRWLAGELAVPGVLEDPDALRYHAYLLSVSAEALRLQGRPQDAVALLELVSRINPGDPAAANDLGRLYSEGGRQADARRMFEHAATLTPGDPTALLNVAILEMAQGRLEDARRTIARARAENPRAAEPWYQLSVLERKANRPDRARHALARALERTDDDRYVKAWRAELSSLPSGRAR